jgi:hypothetical protein
VEENAVATLDHPPILPRDRLNEWRPSELRRVVVRLADGEILQAGTAPNRDSALVLARSIIAELEGSTGEWPMVGNRMVRPGAVLSVDVLSLD